MITLVFILALCCVFVFYVLWVCHILYVLYIDSIITEAISRISVESPFYNILKSYFEIPS